MGALPSRCCNCKHFNSTMDVLVDGGFRKGEVDKVQVCDIRLNGGEYCAYEPIIAPKSEENLKDAISRQEVIWYVKSHIQEIISESGVDKNDHTNRVLRAIINGIETMPPVKQGRG